MKLLLAFLLCALTAHAGTYAATDSQGHAVTITTSTMKVEVQDAYYVPSTSESYSITGATKTHTNHVMVHGDMLFSIADPTLATAIDAGTDVVFTVNLKKFDGTVVAGTITIGKKNVQEVRD